MFCLLFLNNDRILMTIFSTTHYREKWTLFEEAVRVPLMIAHPASPFKGQHYKEPVESVDIYATGECFLLVA